MESREKGSCGHKPKPGRHSIQRPTDMDASAPSESPFWRDRKTPFLGLRVTRYWSWGTEALHVASYFG